MVTMDVNLAERAKSIAQSQNELVFSMDVDEQECELADTLDHCMLEVLHWIQDEKDPAWHTMCSVFERVILPTFGIRYFYLTPSTRFTLLLFSFFSGHRLSRSEIRDSVFVIAMNEALCLFSVLAICSRNKLHFLFTIIKSKLPPRVSHAVTYFSLTLKRDGKVR